MTTMKIHTSPVITNNSIDYSSLDALATSTENAENIKFLIQQFMQDMYSSVDECPFSVTNNQEW